MSNFDKWQFQKSLRGKVITMVGNPASGKTFLAKKLQKFLGAEILYENPDNKIPIQIQESLRTQKNLFKTIVYFRNIQIENHQQALKLANSGKTVILDTPFYNYQLFIDHYLQDSFSREILHKLSELDLVSQKAPDITIYIKTNKQLVKKYLEKRYGSRGWEKTSWTNFISDLPPILDRQFQETRHCLNAVIELKRKDFDFEIENDFEMFLQILDAVL